MGAQDDFVKNSEKILKEAENSMDILNRNHEACKNLLTDPANRAAVDEVMQEFKDSDGNMSQEEVLAKLQAKINI